MLWTYWAHVIWQLKPAFKDTRTFHWFIVICAAFSIRKDFEGVTSFIRTGFINPNQYQSLLDFFHSKAVDREALAREWTRLVFKIFSPFIPKINGKYLLIGDGLIATKEGKKMPGVKSLHQSSQSNSKAEFVMGHYIQLICVLANCGSTFFAVPLSALIHLGIKKSPSENKTIIDKMIKLILSLEIKSNFYFVGDAYYSCQKMTKGLLSIGANIITRVKHNAVAYYFPDEIKSGPGRPAQYGAKVKLVELFKTLKFESDLSPVYGEENVVIQYAIQELLWRPLGIIVKFIFVKSPRGKIILMTTDLSLGALEAIKSYGLRFKIEVSIKVAIHRFGTYCYHFWMKSMKPIKRGSLGQFLHRSEDIYKENVYRKIDAYHLFIQVGLIAQGLTQLLALKKPLQVWATLNSWMRTMNTSKAPSEHVVREALENTKLEFLLTSPNNSIFQKFMEKIHGINFETKKYG